MASTLMVKHGDSLPRVIIAAGSPASVVKAARDTVSRIAGDDSATDAFGTRTFNAAGNLTMSVMERFYGSGLRNGEGFVCMIGDLTVAAASDSDAASLLIAQAAVLQAETYLTLAD